MLIVVAFGVNSALLLLWFSSPSIRPPEHLHTGPGEGDTAGLGTKVNARGCIVDPDIDVDNEIDSFLCKIFIIFYLVLIMLTNDKTKQFNS